jgi:hypothetical protein
VFVPLDFLGKQCIMSLAKKEGYPLLQVVLQKLAEEHDGRGGSLACWA